MNKLTLILITLFCGMLLGVIVAWTFAYNRGVSANVRLKMLSDLDHALVMVHRLRETDTTGVVHMLELQIDANIMGLYEVGRVRPLNGEEKGVFSRALEYRRRNPFRPDEYGRDDGLLPARIAQILASDDDRAAGPPDVPQKR